MSAEWVTAIAAIVVVLFQAGQALMVFQIRDNIHKAIEEFREWAEKTFEKKEVAEKREQMLSQRITDING